MEQKRTLAKTQDLAINSAHAVAFHRGLGNPLHPTSSTPLTKYLQADFLQQFSQVAYNKSNIAIVANGADSGEFSKWVKEFFTDLPSAAPSGEILANTSESKYYGGEERIAHDSGNTMIIAFPGSSSFTGGSWKPEIAVLATLLGGQSSIKWSPGFSALSKATASFPGAQISTHSAVYSDAGLLYVKLSGNALDVRGASKQVVKTIKSIAAGEISTEDFRKAVATAKFRALETGQDIHAGIELTGAGLVSGGKAHQIDEVAKSIDGVSESQLKSVSSHIPASSNCSDSSL
jgi:ubiquinol-cytochrome c reductase core subunit 2